MPGSLLVIAIVGACADDVLTVFGTHNSSVIVDNALIYVSSVAGCCLACDKFLRICLSETPHLHIIQNFRNYLHTYLLTYVHSHVHVQVHVRERVHVHVLTYLLTYLLTYILSIVPMLILSYLLNT